MINIGQINTLDIIREGSAGLHLETEGLGEIILPKNELPEDYESAYTMDVFIYRDSHDRLIATTKRPYAMVGQFAYLKVKDLHPSGAFLDWGLPKDLFIPQREQRLKMIPGKSYVVYVYLDERSGKVTATSKIDKSLDSGPCFYDDGLAVDLLIYGQTDLGYKAIINNTFGGTLFYSEAFQTLNIGQRLPGFIKHVREDGKIDLCLHKPGYAKVDGLSENILNIIQEHDGFIPITDKSHPETIYAMFAMSKKTFKKAIGALYKKRLITLEDDGIRLVENKKT